MVKEEGGGEKTVELLMVPKQPFLFHEQTFITLCSFALIYLHCLKCPAVYGNQT